MPNRIFEFLIPGSNRKKFDADCLYIKQWIPELARIPADKIHQLYKYLPNLMTNYPSQIVEHAIESQESKIMYKINKK